jgi:hypothetical protein
MFLKEDFLMSENLNEEVATADNVVENVVELDSNEEETNIPTLNHNSKGVMGRGTVKKSTVKPKTVESKTESSKVFVFSTDNVYSSEAGKVNIGYTSISKKNADWWTTNYPKQVRIATAEEVEGASNK